MRLNPDTSSPPTLFDRPHGTSDTDWELMFDAPGQGLIAAVENAPNLKALEKILSVVINSLFNRKDDHEFRGNYLAMAKETTAPLADGRESNLEKSKQASVLLLRHIRKQRIRSQEKTTRESDPTRDSKAPGTPEPETNETPVEASFEEPADETVEQDDTKPTPAPILSPDPTKAEDVFIAFLIRSIRQCLDVLALPRLDADKLKGEIPFILSSDFATHFESILKADILPALGPILEGFLGELDKQPEAERQGFMAANMESREHWGPIWGAWQTSWEKLTQSQPMPHKPANFSKGGMLNRLVEKVKDKPGGPRKMTEEQWQEKIRGIMKANAKAEKIWSAISRDADDYLAPEDTDKKILMDLFAQSVSDLEAQMKALYQIATQGGSARAFDAYAKSHDVDLALMALSYRHPNLFIKVTKNEEESEEADVVEAEAEAKAEEEVEIESMELKTESFLKFVLRGYPPDVRKKKFPLVSRYAYPIAE